MKTLQIVALAVVAFIASTCSGACEKKILKYSSLSKDWFDLEYEPHVKGDTKADKLIYGYGWKKSRKNNDTTDDVKSFHVPKESNQKIIITAADGSLFRVKKMTIKSTNVDEVIIRGIASDGQSVEFVRNNYPMEMKRFDKWEKTTMRARGNVISKLEIEAVLHQHPEDARRAEHGIFLRGLKLKVCKK